MTEICYHNSQLARVFVDCMNVGRHVGLLLKNFESITILMVNDSIVYVTGIVSFFLYEGNI